MHALLALECESDRNNYSLYVCILQKRFLQLPTKIIRVLARIMHDISIRVTTRIINVSTVEYFC